MVVAGRIFKAVFFVVVILVVSSAYLVAQYGWGASPERTTAQVFIGIAAILAFDTAGSMASRRLGFRYGKLAPVSYLLYFVIGFLAARIGSTDTSLLVGTTVAAVDASFGWAISWFIGPGRAEWPNDRKPMSVGIAIQTFVIVTLLCGLVALAGGLVSAVLQPNSWIFRR